MNFRDTHGLDVHVRRLRRGEPGATVLVETVRG